MMPHRFLRRYPLFALLDPERLDAWLAAGREVATGTGETLQQAGTEGVCAYLLLEGRVRVSRPTAAGGEVTLGQFSPGDLFGEYALLPPGRNTATCRASSRARLLRLPLAPVRRDLLSHPQVWPNLKNWLRLHTLLHYLRGSSFLGFMSAPTALALLDRTHHADFSASETVQAEAVGADRWYFIEEGRVRLAAGGELGPGDAFGERALLWGARVPVAEAVTGLRCLCLPRADFDPPPGEADQHSLQSVPPRHHGPLSRPWVGQQEAADCGLAALAMVARSRGIDFPLAEIRGRIDVGPGGTSLLGLQMLARSLGLPCLAARVNPGRLGEVALPAIAHLRDGHYVVVYEHGGGVVAVGDPAAGVVAVSEGRFRDQMSGHLLLFRA